MSKVFFQYFKFISHNKTRFNNYDLIINIRSLKVNGLHLFIYNIIHFSTFCLVYKVCDLC